MSDQPVKKTWLERLADLYMRLDAKRFEWWHLKGGSVQIKALAVLVLAPLALLALVAVLLVGAFASARTEEPSLPVVAVEPAEAAPQAAAPAEVAPTRQRAPAPRRVSESEAPTAAEPTPVPELPPITRQSLKQYRAELRAQE